jgi:hypothetical protein
MCAEVAGPTCSGGTPRCRCEAHRLNTRFEGSVETTDMDYLAAVHLARRNCKKCNRGNSLSDLAGTSQWSERIAANIEFEFAHFENTMLLVVKIF